MRRRHRILAAAAAVLAASALAACDTGDGREMKPPTAAQRAELDATTTMAPSTTVPLITQQTFPAPTLGPVEPPSDSAAGGSASVSGGLTAPWKSGTAVDVTYTCNGAGEQPLISWTAPFEGTVELAVTVVDTSTDEPYLHWAVFGLRAAAGELGGGSLPQGAVEATNSDGTIGWVPFCPPVGETHIYVVTLYLLEQQLALPAEADPADLLAAIQLSSFDSHVVTGLVTGAPPTS